MTKPAATTAAPAKPTGSAKAPKAKANGTDGGTLSREDINLAKFIKYEDDGGSSDAHSDDGAVNEDGDMDESKRCVHSLYIGAEVSEKTTEERTRGTAPELTRLARHQRSVTSPENLPFLPQKFNARD